MGRPRKTLQQIDLVNKDHAKIKDVGRADAGHPEGGGEDAGQEGATKDEGLKDGAVVGEPTNEDTISSFESNLLLPVRRGPGRPPGPSSGRLKPVPLSIRKIIQAIDDKGFSRTEIQRRAGWWPNRIHDWLTKGGELLASDAFKSSEVIEIPLSYIMNDSIPLASPPPSRQSYDNSSIIDRARDCGVDSDGLFRGMRLLGLLEDLDVAIPEATRMIMAGVAEREEYRRQEKENNKAMTSLNPITPPTTQEEGNTNNHDKKRSG